MAVRNKISPSVCTVAITEGSSTYVTPRCSQSGRRFQHLQMQWDIAHLLNVFMEPESVMRNATNRWRVRPFNVIAANDATSSNVDGDDRTDSLFRNITANVAFDTFVVFVPYADQKTSVIRVRRSNAWMKYVTEDLQRRRKGVSGGSGTAFSENQIQRTTLCSHRKPECRVYHMSSSHVNK